MRGSGKTTLARHMANTLHKHCVDLDAYLVTEIGMSITDIVSQKGWDYFREKETIFVKKVSTMPDLIISTGGGVILREENVKALKQNGILIYLSAPVETLVSRIQNDAPRPQLIENKSLLDEMETILQQRRSLYENAADITIETEDKSIAVLHDETIEAIKKHI